MKNQCVWLFVLCSWSALAQPQKDLCDGIEAQTEAKIVDAILNGASLGQPCGNSPPLHVALRSSERIAVRFLQVGVDAEAIDANGNSSVALAVDQDKTEIMVALIKQRFSAAPHFENDSEDNAGFVLLGKSARSALPLYILDEQKHQAGRILWGEKIFDLAEHQGQGPSAALSRRAASMLNRWGQISKIDWQALDRMSDLTRVKANLELLLRKKNFIVDFAYVLQEIQRLDDKKDTPKALLQAIQDQAAIGRYITDVQDHIFKLERPRVHAALASMAHILGVKVLPDVYRDAVKWLINRDSHFADIFPQLAEQAMQASQDLDEVKLQAAQLALNSTVQQCMMFIGGLGEAGFQVYQRAAIRLLKAVQMTASLMNTQFATDSFLSLVHDASSNDARLTRAQLEEANLNALGEFDPERINRALTTDQLGTIYELGPAGVSALKLQIVKSRKRSLHWTSPQEGLGTLLHGGWINVVIPKHDRSIFKATRTIGMARGLNIVFEKVELDFSKLGAISREQAAALLVFVQELLDNKQADAEVEFDERLAKHFDANDKALVVAISTTFVTNLNNVLFATHARLRELKPKF